MPPIQETPTLGPRGSSVVAFNNFAHDLMAGNQTCQQSREFAFHNMKVGAANTAGQHAKQNLAGARLGPGHVLDTQAGTKVFARRSKHGSFHAIAMLPSLALLVNPGRAALEGTAEGGCPFVAGDAIRVR